MIVDIDLSGVDISKAPFSVDSKIGVLNITTTIKRSRITDSIMVDIFDKNKNEYMITDYYPTINENIIKYINLIDGGAYQIYFYKKNNNVLEGNNTDWFNFCENFNIYMEAIAYEE